MAKSRRASGKAKGKKGKKGSAKAKQAPAEPAERESLRAFSSLLRAGRQGRLLTAMPAVTRRLPAQQHEERREGAALHLFVLLCPTFLFLSFLFLPFPVAHTRHCSRRHNSFFFAERSLAFLLSLKLSPTLPRFLFSLPPPSHIFSPSLVPRSLAFLFAFLATFAPPIALAFLAAAANLHPPLFLCLALFQPSHLCPTAPQQQPSCSGHGCPSFAHGWPRVLTTASR